MQMWQQLTTEKQIWNERNSCNKNINGRKFDEMKLECKNQKNWNRNSIYDWDVYLTIRLMST